MPWFLKRGWCDIRMLLCFIRKIRKINGKKIIKKKGNILLNVEKIIFFKGKKKFPNEIFWK